MNELTAHVAQYGVEPFLANAHALVALLEHDGKLVAGNPAFSVLGLSSSSNDLIEHVTRAQRKIFLQLLADTSENKVPVKSRLEFLQGGRQVQYDCLFIPLPDERLLFFGERVPVDGHPSETHQQANENSAQTASDLEGVQRLLSRKERELKLVLAQADEIAHTDPLTLLANRLQIIGELQREVTRAGRYQGLLSISMVDIDYFKQVNDTYGHIIGDDVLREIAGCLRDNVRESDTVGRYAGDEFLILLPDTELTAAVEQAGRLCLKVKDMEIKTKGSVVHLTISLGVAQYQVNQETWQQFLSRADMALYDAKNKGRDNWVASACS